MYILEAGPLANVRLENIFSQSVACLFIFLKLSFEAQKFSILQSPAYPSFMDHAFSVSL